MRAGITCRENKNGCRLTDRYREQVGRRVDSLLRYYAAHPQPGERNHKRTLKILRLYCQGLTEQEISDKLKISQPTVHQYLARAIERLKAIKKRL